MADLTDKEIDAALARGRTARFREARAVAARFDTLSGRVVVELAGGCAFAFPARLAQGLEAASAEQLAIVEVLGTGSGLHWEALDVDLSVPDLVDGLFGTRAHTTRMAGSPSKPPRSTVNRRRKSAG